ncbi:Extracellular serine-rich protein like [Verticillium longisporum]|uniref:Extracellular serine-rich protein like n=1 Tax=Verticillium longisporum TaxID=100787 RepID=A0A8I2ZTU7_VERLO|nr:Extracellular serine-rich protein like [Verticillium longisporum]
MRASAFSAVAIANFVQWAKAAHHEVTVGKDGELKFVPETLHARHGDTITYQFFAANHSVTQSSFDAPCQPLQDGFFSAFTPSESKTEASSTTWTITVNDTKPIWVYCGQGKHCQNGMVHSVNALESGNTFQAFKEKAKSASDSTSPADGLPVGGLRVTQVEVGVDEKFVFKPNNIKEPIGTHIQFNFNPKNHSVTQSSFDKPCEQLENGFSSGLIPTVNAPSGISFDIVVNDTKPIWFYCAQGQHCKNGMVGSINAPDEGNTLSAFTEKASKVGAGQLVPLSPIGGVLSANGTILPTLNSAVIDIAPLGLDRIGQIPTPGEHDQYIIGGAGGSPVANYSWPDTISAPAVERLHLLHYLDNILLRVLLRGRDNLQEGGKWAGAYPQTIVNTIASMAAQTWIHRATATDSLQHYKKDLLEGECEYKTDDDDDKEGVDQFLDTVLTLLDLEIGFLVDSSSRLAHSDPWLVGCLTSALGAKSRMAAVANMMQGRAPAIAPREVPVPAGLVYAYAKHKFIKECPGDVMKGWEDGAVRHELNIKEAKRGPDGRVSEVEVHVDDWPYHAKLWLAWMGPWGSLEFTRLEKGVARVPGGFWGHAWVAVTSSADHSMGELIGATVAGPQMVWITQR